MRVYAGKSVEQGEHSSVAGGCANLYDYSGNQNGSFSQNHKYSKDTNSIPLKILYEI